MSSLFTEDNLKSEAIRLLKRNKLDYFCFDRFLNDVVECFDIIIKSSPYSSEGDYYDSVTDGVLVDRIYSKYSNSLSNFNNEKRFEDFLEDCEKYLKQFVTFGEKKSNEKNINEKDKTMNETKEIKQNNVGSSLNKISELLSSGKIDAVDFLRIFDFINNGSYAEPDTFIQNIEVVSKYEKKGGDMLDKEGNPLVDENGQVRKYKDKYCIRFKALKGGDEHFCTVDFDAYQSVEVGLKYVATGNISYKIYGENFNSTPVIHFTNLEDIKEKFFKSLQVCTSKEQSPVSNGEKMQA